MAAQPATSDQNHQTDSNTDVLVRFTWPYARPHADSKIYLAADFTAWTPIIELTVPHGATPRQAPSSGPISGMGASNGGLGPSSAWPCVDVSLARGSHHAFKYVVGGQWCHDMARSSETDPNGNVNNCLVVPARNTLRIATFNLRYATAPDGQNSWNHREPRLVNVLTRMAPDIVGTQECTPEHFGALMRSVGTSNPADCHRTPCSRRCGVGRYGGSTGEHCAVVWDCSSAFLMDSGNSWLSDTPGVPGSNTWHGGFPRLITWAVFNTLAGICVAVCVCSISLLRAHVFQVLNTHLDLNSFPRQQSAKVICAVADQIQSHYECPVIVMGDMNTDKTSEGVWRQLHQLGFCDSWEDAPQKDDGGCHGDTYHGFYPSLYSDPFQKPTSGKSHIDWILYRNPTSAHRRLAVESVRIVTDSVDGYYPSDHFPLLVTFTVQH
ncbi:endonuclease/exonuclease/phosphatase family protein [Pelomyxa schiedti]|nr:endonuclease/exonuclease/phosphatase family protein [Pelomyxa schiedti]